MICPNHQQRLRNYYLVRIRINYLKTIKTMGYIVEAYRDNEHLKKKLYEAKMAVCEAMEALEEMDAMEYNERRGNYRMNQKSNYKGGRYDY